MSAASSDPDPGRLARHLRLTLVLALPIAAAQLAQMGMGLTDTLFLGRLGDIPLAAGGLGANLFFTSLFSLQGLLSGVAVLTARARGAGRDAEVPAIYWSGLTLALLLTVPMFALMSYPDPLLRAAGDKPEVLAAVRIYLHVMRWAVPAGVAGMGLIRGFLPAIERQRLLLYVIPAAVLLNALLNWWLIYGGLGIPPLGLRGAASATTISLWVTALGLLVLLHIDHAAHFVRPAWPRPRIMLSLLAIGLPVGLTMFVEAALFMVTALMIGALGPKALAAHTVAISTASVTFMVPMAIGQAANVRVGFESGAGRPRAARRAGLVAIALAALFMTATATGILLAPGAIAGLYLATGSASLPLALHLLRVAGAFQLADGVQVAASGALRGLKDTRVPMLLATFGYWGIGFWLGRALAFDAGMGVVGLWWGLFGGLAAAALLLTLRFVLISRPHPAPEAA